MQTQKILWCIQVWDIFIGAHLEPSFDAVKGQNLFNRNVKKDNNNLKETL